MSVLKTYKDLAKKHGITDEFNVPDPAKLGFVREQTQQLAPYINRLLYDLTLTEMRLSATDDPDARAAIESKRSGYENDLRQARETLKVSLELVKELQTTVKS